MMLVEEIGRCKDLIDIIGLLWLLVNPIINVLITNTPVWPGFFTGHVHRGNFSSYMVMSKLNSQDFLSPQSNQMKPDHSQLRPQ